MKTIQLLPFLLSLLLCCTGCEDDPFGDEDVDISLQPRVYNLAIARYGADLSQSIVFDLDSLDYYITNLPLAIDVSGADSRRKWYEFFSSKSKNGEDGGELYLHISASDPKLEDLILWDVSGGDGFATESEDGGYDGYDGFAEIIKIDEEEFLTFFDALENKEVDKSKIIVHVLGRE